MTNEETSLNLTSSENQEVKKTPIMIDTRPFTDQQVFAALTLLKNVCSYYRDANNTLGNVNRCNGCPLRGIYDNECSLTEQYYNNEVDTIEEWNIHAPDEPYRALR